VVKAVRESWWPVFEPYYWFLYLKISNMGLYWQASGQYSFWRCCVCCITDTYLANTFNSNQNQFQGFKSVTRK